MHGYKAHVATDQDAGLIRGVEVTTANLHDAAELAAILPAAPGDTYGDTAYSGSRSEAAIRAQGGTPRIVHASTWGSAEALARLKAHNAEVRRVRARIEKVFRTCKRSYGLHRMRWLGLAKAGLQVRLTAMAYNLRRSWRLLTSVPAELSPDSAHGQTDCCTTRESRDGCSLERLDQLKTKPAAAEGQPPDQIKPPARRSH